MNDTDKQRLTRFLGKKWHEYRLQTDGQGPSTCSCGHRGCSVYDICTKENRDFTAPQDVFDLKDRLEKEGSWETFCALVHDNSLASDGDFWSCNLDNEAEEHWAKFYAWLFRTTDESGKPHFARLCCEFLEGRK